MAWNIHELGIISKLIRKIGHSRIYSDGASFTRKYWMNQGGD